MKDMRSMLEAIVIFPRSAENKEGELIRTELPIEEISKEW